MCGIAAIFDLKATRAIDQDALQRMTDALVHRGPDGAGAFTAPGVGLGHRRLAIIDIEGGAQPFETRNGAALSFNGEIYNYKELRAFLGGDAAGWRTQSDTEALAEGLARDGDAFVERLRGMFAFAFWDKKTGRLIAARDRLGERPLYYAETADGFLLIASEIVAIIASGLIALETDHWAIADYFFYGYVPDPKTIYRNIHKLPPGRILSAGAGEPIRIERYWRPTFSGASALSFNEAAEELRALVDDAVSAQMLSDAPLGAFLSGGVDSSGVVAAMAETGASPTTCTIGFSEESHDERSAARATARKFGADHHEDMAEINAAALIDDVARAYGEPFADTSALPSYLVSKLARRHVTVALSGDGGDEIFAGYRRYPFYLAEEKVRAMAPAALRRTVFGPAGALYPSLDWAPRPLRFKSTFQALAQTSAEGYAAAVAINRPARLQKMLSPDFKRALGEYHPHTVVIDAMNEAQTDDALARAQYADLATWLPGRMLTKVDRASMAHSLEVRPPLLDHTIVEWAGGLPGAYKLAREGGKRVLKEALRPRLGDEFLARKKQGFDLPVAAWLRAERNNPLDRLTRSSAWRESGVLSEASIASMIDAHQRGAQDNAQELWTVIMFDAFLRQ
ncbi:MAG: asparagine synthase (glutamine-hydrolyzing) [Pseudomonadota bacterium]